MPLAFALDHINLWLIADGLGWTIIDCGYATDTTRAAWEDILDRHLEGRPVTRVIVTHCHPDHIGLCGWLAGKFGLIPCITKSEFLSSLDGFRRLSPETLVLPSHGLPFRGMHDRIADLNVHHRQRLDKIADVCERPATAAQLLPILFERKLDGHQLIFAMGETIAHLNHLARHGVLKRIEDRDGVYRFVRRTVVARAVGTI